MKSYYELADDLSTCMLNLETLRHLNADDKENVKLIDFCLQITCEDKSDLEYKDLYDKYMYELDESRRDNAIKELVSQKLCQYL